MLSSIKNFYRPDPAIEPLDDQGKIRRRYSYWRWSMFLSVTFGYGFYYVCRLPLSVTKKQLLADQILNTEEMGVIGMALLIGYAIGKLSNGFIADHVNIRRFMVTGIAMSALINLIFGSINIYPLFILLWGINGYMQSMGAPSSGVTIANWFSDRERGTRYGVWCVSHNIGEGITFAGTSLLVSALGWRWGYIGPGILGLIVAVILYLTMRDRPASLGLPPVADYMGDRAPSLIEQNQSIGQLQLEVLKNRKVWVLGVASALMYVARYAVNNWAMLYLSYEKGYSNVAAGFITGIFPIVGALGTMVAGWFSDTFFASRRTPATVFAGLLLILGQWGLYFSPFDAPWLDKLSMGVAGFAIGMLLVYLGGLTAMDICSKRVAGAALGMIGGFSYVGAGLQDYISGRLIKAGKVEWVTGHVFYDFRKVKIFWISASVFSLLLGATLWKSEQERDARDSDKPD